MAPTDASQVTFTQFGTGAVGRTVEAELRETLSVKDFGAVGDGVTDDSVPIQNCLAAAIASGRTMVVDGDFRHVGTLQITSPVKIVGNGADYSILRMDIDRHNEGVHILSPHVSIENLRIDANIPLTMQNGQGAYGTCITIGEMANPTNPTLVHSVSVRDMLLTRSSTAAAHAVALMGRVSHLLFSNITFEGESATKDHGAAFLIHWGYEGDDFPVDGSGVPIKPLVLQRDADTPTYHPNNIHIERCRLKHTGRIASISSAYGVTIDGVDMRGGGQLFDIVVGDESDRYAGPDDKGKVLKGITIKNVHAYDIAGSGPNQLALIDVTGFGTSKYEDNPDTNDRIDEQPEWLGLTFENVFSSAVASDVKELINIRNFAGKVRFDNVHMTGVVGQQGLFMSRFNGSAIYEQCSFNRGVFLKDVEGVTFRNCEFQPSDWPMFPLFAVTVADSTGFDVGDTVTGSVTGVTGIIEAIDGNVISVQATGGWTPFSTSETLDGPDMASSAISAISTVSNACVEIIGETKTAQLDVALAVNDTKVQLKTGGFATPMKVGDKLTYGSGAVLYVAKYADAGVTKIEVTPAPVAAAADDTVTAEHRSQLVRFQDTDIKGGSRALDISSAYTVEIDGGQVSQFGQYGLLCDTGSVVLANDTQFTNGGLRRLSAHDAQLPTRDIAVAGTATVHGTRLRFDDSKFIEHNVKVDSGAAGGSLRDCMFYDTPTASEMAIFGTEFITENNRDASGDLLDQGTATTTVSGLRVKDDDISGPAPRLQSNTADGADTGGVFLSGGGAYSTGDRGGSLALHGNEHPTRPGQTRLFGGTGGVVDIGVNGAIAVQVSETSIAVTEDLLITNDTEFRVRPNTTDGSDDVRVVVQAGGGLDTARGAYLTLSGNEEVTTPGQVVMSSGAGFDVEIRAAGSGNLNLAAGTKVTAGASVEMTKGRAPDFQLTIPDDAVQSFTPSRVHGFLKLQADNSSGGWFLGHFDVGGSPQMDKYAGFANYVASTGVHTGTTGADGQLTVSAADDGSIYIENRRGAQRIINIYLDA